MQQGSPLQWPRNAAVRRGKSRGRAPGNKGPREERGLASPEKREIVHKRGWMSIGADPRRISAPREGIASALIPVRRKHLVAAAARFYDAVIEHARATPKVNPNRLAHASNRTKPLRKRTEITMKRYQPSTPRAFVGLAAAFMTAATLSVSVVAPTTFDAQARDVATSAGQSQSHAYANAGPLTTSIDVIAVRSTRLVPVVHTRVLMRHAVSS